MTSWWLVVGLIVGSFGVGGCSYSGCQGGVRQEMNPAWPLPPTDLDSQIAKHLPGEPSSASISPGRILHLLEIKIH